MEDLEYEVVEEDDDDDEEEEEEEEEEDQGEHEKRRMFSFFKMVFRIRFYVLKSACIYNLKTFQIFLDFRKFRGPKVEGTSSYATARPVSALYGHAHEKHKFLC